MAAEQLVEEEPVKMHRWWVAFPMVLITVAVAVAGAVPVMAVSPLSPAIVFFAPGSSTLTPLGEQTLQSVLSLHRRNGGGIRYVLLAHTDSAEAQSSSVALSPARALAVKKRLIELGVPADRIEVSAFGDSRPLAKVEPGAAEPQNRRVEIIESHVPQ